MEGWPRMMRSPFLAKLLTSRRRAFLGLAGAFLGMAASICWVCSGVSCCPHTSEATNPAPERRRRVRFVMMDLSFHRSFQPGNRRLGFGTDFAIVDQGAGEVQRFLDGVSREQRQHRALLVRLLRQAQDVRQHL